MNFPHVFRLAIPSVFEMSQISIPRVKTAAMPVPQITSPGGLVGSGGYLSSGSSVDRLSRAQFTMPLEALGVTPKKVLK